MLSNEDIFDKRLLNSLRETSKAIHEKLLEENELYKIKNDTDQLIMRIENRKQEIKPAEQEKQVAESEVETPDDGPAKITDLSNALRAHAVVAVMYEAQKPIAIKELERLLTQSKHNVPGDATVSIYNSMIRLLQQEIVKRVKSGKKKLWALNNTDIAKEKINRILKGLNSSNGSSGQTLGDIIEQAIIKAGHRLHLNDIRKALNSAGRTPSLSTLRSGLLRDSKKRFKGLGGGYYTLTDQNFKEKDVAQQDLIK